MKKLVLSMAVIMAIGIACKSTKTATDSAPKVPAEFAEGKQLFEANCGSCHKYAKSYAATPERLKEVIPGMAKMVNDNKGSEVINDAGMEKIMAYVAYKKANM